MAEFNILFVGNSGAGKTAIISRYLQNTFLMSSPTQAIDKRDSLLDLYNRALMAKIIDSPGAEKFRPLLLPEYKAAKAVVLVYDTTSQQSYLDTHSWYNDIHQANQGILYWVLVGNKTDLKDQKKVGTDEAKKFANQIGARFIECSAKLPQNVNLIFLTIQQWTQTQIIPRFVPEQTQRLLEKLQHDEQPKTLDVSRTQKKKKSIPDISFDETNPVDSMQDYFSQKLQRVEKHSKEVAELLVVQSFDKVTRSEVKINFNKSTIIDDLKAGSQDHFNRLFLEKKLRKMDKLRKEISHHLYLVQEKQRNLRVDQLTEHTQNCLLERELQKRLLSVEKKMEFIKTDLILSTRSHRFGSNNSRFQNLDESLVVKQQIDSIHDPEHFQEQQEQILQIIKERKKLEKQREDRYRKHLSELEQHEKEEREKAQREKEEKLNLKKEQLKERLSSMEQLRKEKEEMFRKQNEQLKILTNSKPLHQKLEETFKETTEKTKQESIDKKLKEVRSQHIPIRLPDIKEWEQHYEQKKKKFEEERFEKIKERNKLKFQPSYVSVAYNEVKQEQYEKQKEKERLMQEQQKRQQNVQEFMYKLKDQLPPISSEKQAELEEQTQKLHHRPNFQEYIHIARKVKQKGVFFDKEGKVVDRTIDEEHYKKILEVERNEEDPKVRGNRYLEEARTKLKKPQSQQENLKKSQSAISNPDIESPAKDLKRHKLQKIKEQWKLKKQLETNIKLEDAELETAMEYGLDHKELLEQANRAAKKAIRKFEVQKAIGSQNSIKELEKADKLLINSIKAKLQAIEMDDMYSVKAAKRGRAATKQSQEH